MNDSYVELLVKRKTPMSVFMLRSLCYAGFAGLLMMALLMRSVLFLALALAALVAGFLVKFFLMNIEYEYLYLDKHLSVDCIRNQQRRKQVTEYDLSNLEMMAPIGSHHMDRYKDRNIKTRDFTCGTQSETAYAMVFKRGANYEIALIEANEELLHQISMAAPRKVMD